MALNVSDLLYEINLLLNRLHGRLFQADSETKVRLVLLTSLKVGGTLCLYLEVCLSLFVGFGNQTIYC